MFKLALGAGHRIETPGKRIPKELDPNETREWILNDRICDKVEVLLAGYDGIEVLRVDDTNGIEPISVTQRNQLANDWGADYALAVHHNAAGRVFDGGGIVVYRDPKAVDFETLWWHEAMYRALTAHTGLVGNRANPLATANLSMLTGTRMPATLLELGFMDSTVDSKIILTEEYATQCAEAIVEVIVNKTGITRKDDEEVRYKYLADIPANWNFRAIIEMLMTARIINGDGSDPNGNGDVIDLSMDMVRMLMFNYNAGCYDDAIRAVGLDPDTYR